jgi:cysteine desulfurase/selenocysteine lyase
MCRAFFEEEGAFRPEGLPKLAGLPAEVPKPNRTSDASGFLGNQPSLESPLPPAPFFQEASPASPRDSGLSGGFPSTSNSQPVHPVTEPASPHAAEAPLSQVSSGEHRQSSPEAHPFGEPSNHGQFESATNQSSLKSHAPQQESEPDFYFIHRPGTGAPARETALTAFDVHALRRDFPALHQRVNGHQLVYLDNAATTHKPQSVLDATSVFYGRDNANIHRAAHALSERATAAFEAGREKVRRFLGAADKKEIVFVRGTTEGINLVAQSYGRKHIGPGDEIILSQLEHHANIVPWQLLAEQVGAALRVIPMNSRGELILEEFVKLLGPKTKFVSIGHVSNALGTVNPVQEIVSLAHSHGVPVLVDGAQSAPHIPLNVTALDADFYVFSGHKVFGPTGIGALYGKAHLLEAMPPYQGGGHMIEDVRFEKTVYRDAPEKFEAGTPDIAGVIGLGAAIDYLFEVGIPALAAYEHALLEYATAALETVRGLRLIGTAREKASVLSFLIDGVSNRDIAAHLDQRGIAVRAGHHCALPTQRHFGVESTVRPSLAFYNTREEVDALVGALHSLQRR